MMTVESIVEKHGLELEGIKSNIHSISVDLQLLIRDNKYITTKMEELREKIESLSSYLYCIDNHTKMIERIMKDQEILFNQQREFEQKLRAIDEREKIRSSLWKTLGEQWWKILTVLSSLAVLSYQFGDVLRRTFPHS